MGLPLEEAVRLREPPREDPLPVAIRGAVPVVNQEAVLVVTLREEMLPGEPLRTMSPRFR